MKDLSVFLSVAALVILFGYITYDSWDVSPAPFSADAESMETVAPQSRNMPVVSIDIPLNMSFAGEPVPLDIPDVRERLDKELQINTYLHSSTLLMMKRAHRWLPQIEAILTEHNIPSDFKYLPLIESALLNDISPKAAVGFWQILQPSGRELGLEINREVDERYDPLKATVAACKYLQKAYDRFGNWTLAAASYNRGMSGISRDKDSQHVESYYDIYLNDETSRYVFRILAIKEIIENPDKYGFSVSPEHLYESEKVRYVMVDQTVRDLVSFAQQQGINYKLLKRHNPWLRSDKLTVGRGKTYEIAVPLEIELAGAP